MGYIMYVCPACRRYFKTGGADKKIKCPKCEDGYLLSLKISDEKWRALEKEVRQARINRALAGEQLRDEAPKKEESPVIPADAPIKKPEGSTGSHEDLFKPDAPDEAILEARRLLEQKDVQAEMPAPQMDYKKFFVVVGVAFALLFIPAVLNVLVPAITIKKELTAIVQAKPGDTVKFGRHKGNTSWRVLEVEDDRVLIICDHPVKANISKDPVGIPQGSEPVSVEQVTGDWLNSKFLNGYFNVCERARIIPPEEGANKVLILPGEQPNDGIYPAFWVRF